MELKKTDSEFVEFFNKFACEEVVIQTQLDTKTRWMSILATLLGCQGVDEFKIILPKALKDLTPIEIKEIIYQAVAYLGIGRVYPFLVATNVIFEQNGIKLPLENQSNTTEKTRLEKGVQAQVDIFGDGMKEFYKSGPKETVHINRWLAANCFGDYYTRNGLDYRQRELVTFCYISAQGGCEPQLTAHALANLKVGNSKEILINIVSAMIPYIGYPRSLNALNCVQNASKEFEERK
jgi:4-carboxymuconolactone decarboxylase